MSDMTNTPRRPALRNEDREMIPMALIKAMGMLVLCTLVLVSYAVFTERTLVGQPLPSTIVAQTTVVLEGSTNGSVIVKRQDGSVLKAFGPKEAGFISVVWIGLKRERFVHQVDLLEPVRLAQYENGRLAIFDDITGWTVELGSFGSENRAAFAKLF
ncbi:MAG: putative photosynthetic complex assembly protein [Paracoccaceae bacterium]|jgi:putative photosynthetic complex assembly protein